MKRVKAILSLVFACSFVNQVSAQVAINTDNSSPIASAMLEISSTSKGLLIPRMTTTQRTAIASPATGLLVFDATLGSFYYYSGSAWTKLSTNVATQNIQLGSYWLSGDGGNEGVYVASDGKVGIGSSAPTQKLHVSGTGSDLGLRLENSTISSGKNWLINSHGLTGNLDFYCTSTATNVMSVGSGGSVGFGTTSPTQAKVVINGSTSYSIAGYGFLNRTGAGSTSTTSSGNLSLYASNRIAAEEFNATSDRRIKKIIGLSNASNDLKTLMAIRITDYSFRDTISKGHSLKKKVIAQELKEVFPQAVSITTDVVPDVYKKASLKNGWVQLSTDLKPGEKVQLITETEKKVYTVLKATKEAFQIDNAGSEQQVFVYGREVNDFHNVDYEAIAMLNVSATQELYRLLEKQQQVINLQKQQIETLEAKLQKVNELEAAVKQLQNQQFSNTAACLVPVVSK